MELARNKQAYFDYEILDSFEAGLVLTGPEVKSAKCKKIDLKGSYVTVKDGSLWLVGAHIAPYLPAKGVQKDYHPKQERKLLLHKKEINYLRGQLTRPGLTIVPLKVYTKSGLIKVEIGLVRGKKKYEKKEKIKKRDIDREVSRTLKGYQ